MIGRIHSLLVLALMLVAGLRSQGAEITNPPPPFHLNTNYPAFSIVIIPDTQNMMLQLKSNYWKQTVEWIETNKALKVAAVLGVGDCVDHLDMTNQWLTFMHGLKYFNNTPFVLAAGNHDVPRGLRDYEIFNRYISSNYYASKPWWARAGHGFVTEGEQENMYITLTNGPLKLLVGTLEFGPTTNQVHWFARECLAHPDHLCFLTTHNYMNRDGSLNINGQIHSSTNISHSPMAYDLTDSCDGESVFALLKGVPNLVLIACGHHICSPNEAFRTDVGTYGNLINGQFVNYQCDRYSGGPDNGYFMSRLKVITFTPGGTGLARTFDPVKMTWTNPADDHPVKLSGSKP